MKYKNCLEGKVTNKQAKLINILTGYRETKTNLFIYKTKKADSKSNELQIYIGTIRAHNTHNRTFLQSIKTFMEMSCSNEGIFKAVHSLEIAEAREAL